MFNQPYQPSFGQQPVQSQYRGAQKQFQPTGFVQSFYNNQPMSQSFAPNPQSYHTANYVGNRRDHDAFLREDSQSPSAMRSQSFGGVSALSNSMQQQQQIQQHPSSYHTQNYVGNRQDHDAYLREDSMRPSSIGASRAQSMNSIGSLQQPLPAQQFQANVPSQLSWNQANQFGQHRNF